MVLFITGIYDQTKKKGENVQGFFREMDFRWESVSFSVNLTLKTISAQPLFILAAPKFNLKTCQFSGKPERTRRKTNFRKKWH